MNRYLKNIFIFPIRFYQWAISPHLGKTCRYEPSCSHYMVQAIEEWGILKGGWLGTKRLFTCHPWGGHGYDPVPKKLNKEQYVKKTKKEST